MFSLRRNIGTGFVLVGVVVHIFEPNQAASEGQIGVSDDGNVLKRSRGSGISRIDVNLVLAYLEFDVVRDAAIVRWRSDAIEWSYCKLSSIFRVIYKIISYDYGGTHAPAPYVVGVVHAPSAGSDASMEAKAEAVFRDWLPSITMNKWGRHRKIRHPELRPGGVRAVRVIRNIKGYCARTSCKIEWLLRIHCKDRHCSGIVRTVQVVVT